MAEFDILQACFKMIWAQFCEMARKFNELSARINTSSICILLCRYRKVQKQCRANEPVCHMGGYTRLLHGGEPDDLMPEIPTVVVRPLEDKDNEG